MKRGGHFLSEPSLRRRNSGRYGAIVALFNAMRRRARTPRPPVAAAMGAVQLIVGAIMMVMALTSAATPVLARGPIILDFGDSLTAGLGLPASQAFPTRLEAWLHQRGIEARVINAGISGDTTSGGLARLDWALTEKPDLVILALGANDALRGIDPSTVRDNLDKMIAKIEARGAKVLLLGMLAPPNWGEEYKRAFDRIFPELARAHHLPLYPFFLEGVAMKPEFNQPDGLHPNERGVGVLVDRIAPVVAGLIGGAS
jgi:acyl-CoA thioesterase-1